MAREPNSLIAGVVQLAGAVLEDVVETVEHRVNQFQMHQWPKVTNVAGRFRRRAVRTAEVGASVAAEVIHLIRIDVLPQWRYRAKKTAKFLGQKFGSMKWH